MVFSAIFGVIAFVLFILVLTYTDKKNRHIANPHWLINGGDAIVARTTTAWNWCWGHTRARRFFRRLLRLIFKPAVRVRLRQIRMMQAPPANHAHHTGAHAAGHRNGGAVHHGRAHGAHGGHAAHNAHGAHGGGHGEHDHAPIPSVWMMFNVTIIMFIVCFGLLVGMKGCWNNSIVPRAKASVPEWYKAYPTNKVVK